MSFKNEKNKYIIQEIVIALENLSKNKIGATIIFEKNNIIDSLLTAEGTRLNSEISSDLIFSIFAFKNNQLHDGAMIIDMDLKIKSVGCFLPIKKIKKVSKNLGARHRAAQTITSMINVVVVVVSERDGSISCFYKNKNELKSKDVSKILEWLKKEV